MTEENPSDNKAAPKSPPQARNSGKAEDLSAQIAEFVERRPGDLVRCTKVGADRYRCNWWAAEPTGGYDNPGMGGLLVTTHRVRDSQFFRVTRQPEGGLVFQVLSVHPR